MFLFVILFYLFIFLFVQVFMKFIFAEIRYGILTKLSLNFNRIKRKNEDEKREIFLSAKNKHSFPLQKKSLFAFNFDLFMLIQFENQIILMRSLVYMLR